MRGSFLYFNENNWYNFLFHSAQNMLCPRRFNIGGYFFPTGFSHFLHRGEVITQKGLVFFFFAILHHKNIEAEQQSLPSSSKQHNYEMTFLSLLLFKSYIKRESRLLDCIKRTTTECVVCHTTLVYTIFVLLLEDNVLCTSTRHL